MVYGTECITKQVTFGITHLVQSFAMVPQSITVYYLIIQLILIVYFFGKQTD